MVSDSDEVYMTEDPAEFLRNYIKSLTPGRNCNFRWYCSAVFLYQVLIEAITTYKIFFGGEQYRSCLTGVLIHLPGIISLGASIFTDILLDGIEPKFLKLCNPLESVTEEISSKISRKNIRMKRICLFGAVALVLASCGSYPITKEDDKYICTIWILEGYFGSCYGVFSLTTILAMIANGLAATNMMSLFLYANCLFEYQLYLIHEHLENMRLLVKNKFGHDVIYQSLVYQNISYFVQQHNKWRTLVRTYLRPFEKFAAVGVLMAGEIILVTVLYLLFGDVYFSLIPRAIIGLVVGCSTIILMFHCGQFLINETNRTHSLLCDMPWQDWNKKNRDTLLIILPITAKPMKVSCPGLCELSYPFMLAAIKLAYSLLTLAMDLK